MKKSDLKVGMKVELFHGQKWHVYRGKDFLYIAPFKYSLRKIFIDHLSDNLEIAMYSMKYDIMKVYDENGKLIWEREV